MGFGLEQYDKLAELLRTMAGKAIVSVNDTPQMRQAFKGPDDAAAEDQIQRGRIGEEPDREGRTADQELVKRRCSEPGAL